MGQRTSLNGRPVCAGAPPSARGLGDERGLTFELSGVRWHSVPTSICVDRLHNLLQLQAKTVSLWGKAGLYNIHIAVVLRTRADDAFASRRLDLNSKNNTTDDPFWDRLQARPLVISDYSPFPFVAIWCSLRQECFSNNLDGIVLDKVDQGATVSILDALRLANESKILGSGREQ